MRGEDQFAKDAIRWLLLAERAALRRPEVATLFDWIPDTSAANSLGLNSYECQNLGRSYVVSCVQAEEYSTRYSYSASVYTTQIESVLKFKLEVRDAPGRLICHYADQGGSDLARLHKAIEQRQSKIDAPAREKLLAETDKHMKSLGIQAPARNRRLNRGAGLER